MKKKILIIIAAIVIIVPAYFILFNHSSVHNDDQEKQLYTCGMHPEIISEEPGNCPICEMKLTPMKSGNKSSERKILFYRSPMNPEVISDHPQKDEMGMDYVPVYEDEANAEGIVTIDPKVQQNMNIKTTKVEVKELSNKVVTNGILQTNETNEYIVTTRVNGWVEKLYVNYTGQYISKGAKLMDIYSPELVSAQQELLTALSYQNSLNTSSFSAIKESGNELVKNAIRKLELLEVSEAVIKNLIDSKEVKTYLTLYAPKSGTILEKNIIEGQKIMGGMPLLKIADLSNLWLLTDIYEYELSKVKVGSTAAISFNFFPGKKYKGIVSFIYPTLDPKTRTVKLRIEITNRGELKPAMFANVVIEGNSFGRKTVVPENAVIRSGLKDIVILSLGNGKFKPQQVVLGSYSDEFYQVLEGLSEGSVIVTSAQFLIDSESNLKAAVNQFQSSAQNHSAQQAKVKNDIKENSSKTRSMTEHSHSESIVHSGVIDVEAIDKNKDGKVFQDMMDWNVISDNPGKCPLCGMILKEVSISEAKMNLEKNGFEFKKNRTQMTQKKLIQTDQ